MKESEKGLGVLYLEELRVQIWELLRSHKRVMIFPFVSMLSVVVITLIFIILFFLGPSLLSTSRVVILLYNVLLFMGYLLANYVLMYFSYTAITAFILGILNEGRARFFYSIWMALIRFGMILRLALLNVVVGFFSKETVRVFGNGEGEDEEGVDDNFMEEVDVVGEGEVEEMVAEDIEGESVIERRFFFWIQRVLGERVNRYLAELLQGHWSILQFFIFPILVSENLSLKGAVERSWELYQRFEREESFYQLSLELSSFMKLLGVSMAFCIALILLFFFDLVSLSILIGFVIFFWLILLPIIFLFNIIVKVILRALVYNRLSSVGEGVRFSVYLDEEDEEIFRKDEEYRLQRRSRLDGEDG